MGKKSHLYQGKPPQRGWLSHKEHEQKKKDAAEGKKTEETWKDRATRLWNKAEKDLRKAKRGEVVEYEPLRATDWRVGLRQKPVLSSGYSVREVDSQDVDHCEESVRVAKSNSCEATREARQLRREEVVKELGKKKKRKQEKRRREAMGW